MHAWRVNTVVVSSIDETVAAIRKNGGSVIYEKRIVPGIGYHAYCGDPGGTRFGILQPDMTIR